MISTSKNISLYGGALTATLPNEPLRFSDISDVRLVPDHQEVYLDVVTNSSIILELLELGEGQSDEDSLLIQFNDLCQHNESAASSVISGPIRINNDLNRQCQFIPNINNENSRVCLIGHQRVQKHRSPTAPFDTILVVLVLVRLRGVATDLLISLNLPLPSEGALNDIIPYLDARVVLTPGSSDNLEPMLNHLPALVAFRELLNTLSIVDWGLFGHSN